MKSNIKFKNTGSEYGIISSFLHWFLASLIIVMLILGLCLDIIPREYRGFAMGVHKSLGVLILFAVLIRIIWRFYSPPPVSLSPNILQKIAAKCLHFLLYLAMLIMPVSGLVLIMARGGNINLFGFVNFPSFLAADKIIKNYAGSTHSILAYILIGMIALHFIAALYHHFVLKDNILKRMLRK